MSQHLDQSVRVAELAALANTSSSHYFVLFKRQTGRAPIDYFIGLKMRRARTLLESTTASVKEIAVSLGYKDPLYFSRLFKSVHQTAPTRYRARQKGSRPAGERSLARGLPEPSRLGSLETSAAARRFPVAPAYQFA